MKYSNLLLFMAAAAMTHAGAMSAQTVNWVEMGSPSARDGMGMAYDESTHSTVLFGGSNNDKEILGDTWIWRGAWFRTYPAASPSPRGCVGMAYDAAAGDIVLFGGANSAGAFFNDTWTGDGTNWTQQFPPVSPPARACMGFAYDGASKTVVLFGGSSAGGGSLGDTWTWDGVAKTWTQQNPAASPFARSGASMAYDAATKTVVLFGGSGVSAAYGDTWNWNGAIWIQQSPTSAPSARNQPAMAYDAGLGAVVLFGGAVGGAWQDSTNDTWTWNGTNWTEIYPATVPPNRYNFGMDYDPIIKALLMFGGYSSGPARGDTWLLALAP